MMIVGFLWADEKGEASDNNHKTLHRKNFLFYFFIILWRRSIRESAVDKLKPVEEKEEEEGESLKSSASNFHSLSSCFDSEDQDKKKFTKVWIGEIKKCPRQKFSPLQSVKLRFLKKRGKLDPFS